MNSMCGNSVNSVQLDKKLTSNIAAIIATALSKQKYSYT